MPRQFSENATQNSGNKQQRTRKRKQESNTKIFEGAPPKEDLPKSLNFTEWPKGWSKQVFRRKGGNGQKDRYWLSPEGKRFRSLAEIERFFQNEKNADDNNEEAPKKKPNQKLLADAKREARQTFENEKKETLELVPDSIQEMWGQVGFAKWNKTHLPVLNLSPYDVPPGPVRDMWFDMFEIHENGKTLEKMSYLVYWYGEKNPNQYYSLVAPSTFVRYIDAPETMKNFADTSEQKQQASKKLSALDEQKLRALKEVQEDLSKLLEDRRRGVIDFQELHERLTSADCEELSVTADVADEVVDEDDERAPTPKRRRTTLSQSKAKSFSATKTVPARASSFDSTDDEMDDENKTEENDDWAFVVDGHYSIRKLHLTITKYGLDRVRTELKKRRNTNCIKWVVQIANQIERLSGLGFTADNILNAVHKQHQEGGTLSAIANTLKDLTAADIKESSKNGTRLKPSTDTEGTNKQLSRENEELAQALAAAKKEVEKLKQEQAETASLLEQKEKKWGKVIENRDRRIHRLKQQLDKTSAKRDELKSTIDKLAFEKNGTKTDHLPEQKKHPTESPNTPDVEFKNSQLDLMEKRIGSTMRENARLSVENEKLHSTIRSLNESLKASSEKRGQAKSQSSPGVIDV